MARDGISLELSRTWRRWSSATPMEVHWRFSGEGVTQEWLARRGGRGAESGKRRAEELSSAVGAEVQCCAKSS